LGTRQTFLKLPGAQANLAVKLQRSVTKAVGVEKRFRSRVLITLYLLTSQSTYSDSLKQSAVNSAWQELRKGRWTGPSTPAVPWLLTPLAPFSVPHWGIAMEEG